MPSAGAKDTVARIGEAGQRTVRLYFVKAFFCKRIAFIGRIVYNRISVVSAEPKNMEEIEWIILTETTTTVHR